jgi:hypothetical protein
MKWLARNARQNNGQLLLLLLICGYCARETLVLARHDVA